MDRSLAEEEVLELGGKQQAWTDQEEVAPTTRKEAIFYCCWEHCSYCDYLWPAGPMAPAHGASAPRLPPSAEVTSEVFTAETLTHHPRALSQHSGSSMKEGLKEEEYQLRKQDGHRRISLGSRETPPPFS